MNTPAADIALLTERRYAAPTAPPGERYFANVLRDDALLMAALARLGLTAVRVDWAADVDWSRFRVAVFRTTWDYFHRIGEFRAWLARVRGATRLCNDATTVEWNLDKRYLADLEAAGVPIVPCRFLPKGCGMTLHALLDECGWDEAVVKPCVSGAARHTYRVDRAGADALEPVVRRLVAEEALILQPFQRSIAQEGEDSLMLFRGRYSHAVRKVPKPGDFRVQDDHGGTVHACRPSPAQVELAERAVAGRAPTYARVDMVRDDGGNFAVMELELIEPELWLREHPPAAVALAEAIAATVA